MPEVKKPVRSLAEVLMEIDSQSKKLFFSNWGVDALDDEDATSAKNKTSVITQLVVEGRRLLFTGDAGITALSHALDNMVWSSQLAQWALIQIPHHGSRRNVGPTILNRLVGTPLPPGMTRNVFAVVSTASKGDPKHPYKAVMNALTHRGVNAMATRGKTTRYAYNAPCRWGWNAVVSDQYYWVYEDEK
ncbi:MAG: hypothetical protein OXE42_12030 [Gammaproteobacteria bacterium]|nr:hypothetical protein [Gammaproteobacteria bacterium]